MISPSMRFAAQDFLRYSELDSDEVRAVRKATYVESFPNSYSAAQVEAAEALLLQFTPGRPFGPGAFEQACEAMLAAEPA